MATGSIITLRYPTRGARKVIDAQARRLPRGFGQMLDAGAQIYIEELVLRTPVGERGEGDNRPHARDSWRSRRSGSGGSASRQVVNLRGHIRFVIGGTRAHVIIARHTIKKGPRKGQLGYLRFAGSGGDPVFRRKVYHPGNAANPFQQDAIKAGRARVRGSMHTAMRAIISESHA
jgi:hypothetical protein